MEEYKKGPPEMEDRGKRRKEMKGRGGERRDRGKDEVKRGENYEMEGGG